jgi:hypothetical protein
MRSWLALGCFLFAGGAAAEVRDRPLSLFHDSWPVVEAWVSGTRVRLLVDTGTNHTVIDTGLARRLGWRVSDCQTISGGMLGEICRVDLPAIEIDGRRLPATRGLAADMMHSELGEALEVDGLLGGDLLSHGVLVLDFPHSRWSLIEAKQFRPPEGQPPIAIEIDDLVVNVPITVGEHAARFILDSGNLGPPIVLGVPDQERLVSPKARRMPNGIRSGAGGSADSVSGRADLRIGGANWRGVRVLVAEHPSQAGSVMAYRQGILGLQFLRHFRLTVDYPGHRMFLEQELPLPSAPPPSLGMIARPRNGRLIVDALAHAGPAEKAGVHVGDQILAVEEVPVSALNLAVITRSLLPVVSGQPIKLTIRSGSAAPRSLLLVADVEP